MSSTALCATIYDREGYSATYCNDCLCANNPGGYYPQCSNLYMGSCWIIFALRIAWKLVEYLLTILIAVAISYFILRREIDNRSGKGTTKK